MSGLLMGHAFYEELPPLQKLLLLAIADHANDDGYGAYPSQKRLAEKVGCSTRHINTLTTTLVSLGLLEITQQGGGRGHTTRYLLPWASDIQRRIKGEKAEQTTTKAELQSSSDPSLEPSEDSEPPRQSKIDSSSPPPTAASAVANFLACSKNERVGKLIELGDALDFPRNGGLAAAIVRDFGEDRQAIVDAAIAYVRNHGLGEPGEYMRKVLGNGQESQVRHRGFDPNRGAGDSRQQVAQGGSEILTEDEARSILAARADAEGGGGTGAEAQPED